MNEAKIIKEFDKKFPSWKNTKFDWKTGDIEYKQDTKGTEVMIVAKRKEIKDFWLSKLSIQKKELLEKIMETAEIDISLFPAFPKKKMTIENMIILAVKLGIAKAVNEKNEKCID